MRVVEPSRAAANNRQLLGISRIEAGLTAAGEDMLGALCAA